jgi:hypothetical protein
MSLECCIQKADECANVVAQSTGTTYSKKKRSDRNFRFFFSHNVVEIVHTEVALKTVIDIVNIERKNLID